MDYSQLGTKRRKRLQRSQTTRVRNKIALLTLRVALGIVLIGGFALIGAGLGLYRGILDAAPELDWNLIHSRYVSSSIICGQTGEELVRLHGGHNHESVSLDLIPMHLRLAFIAIEDERFFEHNGVDIRGMGRAAHTLIATGGATTQGASTITQQLVKNMKEQFESDLIFKLQEQYLAIRLEQHLTEQYAAMFGGCMETGRMMAKDAILEAYLNIINLGRQNYGVQAAAWFYYGVCVSELTIAQSATIAAITQNPSAFPPDTRPERNWERAQLVLANMYRLEFITSEEYYAALNSNVYDTIFRMESGGLRPITSQFDCFTDAILSQVRADLMAMGMPGTEADRLIFSGGLQIFSTQDHRMQAAIDRVFLDDSYWPTAAQGFSIDVNYQMTVLNSITGQRRHYPLQENFRNLEEYHAFLYNWQNQRKHATDEIDSYVEIITPQPQGAFVVMDHHNGHVLAMRGIRGERQGNRLFCRASRATRSPGSQMKPLTFGAGIEMGIFYPAYVIDDIPFSNENPWPRNWWGSTFEGFNTVRRAIYRSMNVVSVRAVADERIEHVGLENMFNFVSNLGFTSLVYRRGTFTDAVAAMPLGGLTDGVILVELAAAYAAIANHGNYNRPVFYTHILDMDGNILLENTHNPRRVMRETTAYMLVSSMMDTMRGSGATGHQINWADDVAMRQNIPISGKTGTSQVVRDLGFTGFTPYYTAAIWMGNDNNFPMNQRNNHHLPMWRSIMQEIHQGYAPRSFIRPPDIVTRSVCRDSGHTPGPFCTMDPRGSRVTSDIFASGQAPSQTCEVHQQFTYCTVSGRLRGPNCDHENVVTRVGHVRAIPIVGNITVLHRHLEFPSGVLEGLICDTCEFVPYVPQPPTHEVDDWLNSPNNPWGNNNPWNQGNPQENQGTQQPGASIPGLPDYGGSVPGLPSGDSDRPPDSTPSVPGLPQSSPSPTPQPTPTPTLPPALPPADPYIPLDNNAPSLFG